jgi:predicted adenylyl cyclase CyaB
MPINYEFKAKSTQNQRYEQLLLAEKADFKGVDFQKDTYFNVPNGRMKLREGNIENFLIHYLRSNDAAAKVSEVLLYKTAVDSNLKTLLTTALGVKVVVDKKRKIFFIDNVKFHLDEIEGLGEFVEIEAIDTDGTRSIADLKAQCDFYQHFLGIENKDMMAISYSDMLLIGHK